MKRRKQACGIIIVLLTVLVIVVSIPSERPLPIARAQFTLASWSFPDEYGQGIEYFKFYENSTGSWLLKETTWYYNTSNLYEWDEGVGIKLQCATLFNETLTGSADTAEGKNYQRHNVTVTIPTGPTIFSQQNFTYFSVDDGIYPDLWLYVYEVVLGFLPSGGLVYAVTVTYEIYW